MRVSARNPGVAKFFGDGALTLDPATQRSGHAPMRAVLGMRAAMRSANGRSDGALSAATPAHSGGGLNAADGGAPGLNARYSATYSSKWDPLHRQRGLRASTFRLM